MPYKNKQEMINDEDFVQTREDLLNEKVLNWPHNVLANNMDAIKPRQDIVALVTGEEYSTFMDENTPNYDDPITGEKTKYVQNGMSFKEALMTLDRAAKNLKNLILSKSGLPVDTSPFITPGGVVQLSPGESYTSWAIIPDSSAVVIKDGPLARAPHLSPRILYTGGITKSQDLIGIGVVPRGSYGGIAKVYYSGDMGKTWKIPGGVFDANIMEYWSYLSGWSSLYIDGEKNLNVLMGRTNSSEVLFGRVRWDAENLVWIDLNNKFNNVQEHGFPSAFYQVDLKDARDTADETAWAWVASDNKTIRVGVSNKSFVYRMAIGGAVPSNSIDINYGTLSFAEVNSPSIVFFEEYSPRIMYVVFSGRLKGETRFGVYQATFENGGGNTLTQVTTYGKNIYPLLTSDNYDYVSPSFIELTSGFVGLCFTTNEGQTSTEDIRTIEFILYNKITGRWFSKSILYVQKPIIGWDPGRNSWPRATIVESIGGQIVCFVEELKSKADMPDFSAGTFNGVEKAYTRLVRIELAIKS